MKSGKNKEDIKKRFTKKRKRIYFHGLTIYVQFNEKIYDKIYK